ncbi:TIGR00366 family protein [Bacillaceae bacterium Marseille-Q3522]|nr:TIGR00366 family protein [Bacillaceae bacterium Marseille-Q3522]
MGVISNFFTKLVNKYMPDPLVFAILLTILVFFLGIGLTPSTPLDMIEMWGDGFWGLLAFAMQMVLVIVTGHALAATPLVRKYMGKTAAIAKTPAQGVMLVTFASAVACAVNWGFGLIVGAMFAKEVARKVPKSDYRLLIASAYIGFLTWHGGLSASIALTAATKGNPMEETVGGIIPITETLFTPYNIFITIALIVTLPFLTRMMMRKDFVEVDPALLKEEPLTQIKLGKDASFAQKLEESRILAYTISASGIFYLIFYFKNNGLDLNINTVNFIFFILGLFLHGTPMSYMRAVKNAAASTAGIMVQFPFYAGIQIMMEHSGLGGLITEAFINIANADTFPILTFLSSGVINFAVPSGGGHWVVQGPFVIPAAQALGADMGKAAMAIAYGEAWLNMAQPFWALPALAIAGLGVRDIMGYCATALLWSGLIFMGALYFL